MARFFADGGSLRRLRRSAGKKGGLRDELTGGAMCSSEGLRDGIRKSQGMTWEE